RNKLMDVAEDSEQPLPGRIAAVGALNSLWTDEVKELFLALLYAGDPNLRRLAADGLALNCKPGDTEADQTLLQVMGDQDLAARRAIVLAAGRIGGPNAADSLANTFKAYKEEDPNLYDAILRAIERLGKPGIDKLIALALSGVDKDFNRVVDAFAALRSRAAADAIPDLLYYPHLTIPQRVSLIKSYSNYLFDPPVSLAPLVKYADAQKDAPPQVRLAALEVLTLPGQLKNSKSEELALSLLDSADTGFRLAVIRAIDNGRLSKA